MTSYMPFVATVISVAALLLNLATFIRAGKWKESAEFKELHDRIGKHEARLEAGEERFKSLATTADIAEVRAEVRALEKALEKVDGGVIRIEKILMGIKQ